MTLRDDSPNARYEALVQLLRTADTLWNASRAFFARWNLSPSQFNVLNLLSDQPDGVSQTGLGRLLITHRSNVTGLVDRLEQRGLVLRADNAGDRRAYRVRLTDPGHRLLKRILPEFHHLAEDVWDGMPAARARQLADALESLSQRARQIPTTRKDP
jgi:MarR family 2-MHQ and catechol resistance regulon transcriptional repressor